MTITIVSLVSFESSTTPYCSSSHKSFKLFFPNYHFILVLKYADSVLKGYATAVSVVLTGVLSTYLFHTKLTVLFGLGMINVVLSTVLYNGSGFDEFVC